ncbi:MAG: NAD-dependent epimerase/dehydratase family protein [Bacteroidetes bacterium]|nr:NAD-dependent epimerase/dehydratase family protein [Bacteroidota bacterium]
MTTINKSKPVMVTGATGYVAGWVVKRLLEEGLTVHATVRNPDDKQKLAHLDAIAANAPGSIRYFKAELLTEGSFAEAMKDCELVYHTASPYTLDVKDPQRDLVDPALKGTQNVLMQANKTPSVKRVVVTSSCAAIYSDCSDLDRTPNGIFTEEIWNTTSNLEYQPYSYSKTLAEKEAWRIAGEQNQWDLVVVNPCGVFGPALNPKYSTSESTSMLKQLGDGTLKTGAPNIGIGIVDVRDLADAHFAAGFNPDANGRNIICGHNSSMLEMAKILHKEFGNTHAVPNRAVPKWLLMMVGPMVNKVITRRFVKNNVNREWKADNSKSKRELGMKYRPLEETLHDSFHALIDGGVLKTGKK